jgi:hypothetical protein
MNTIETQQVMKIDSELENIQDKIVAKMTEQIDKHMLEFFTPYLRMAGIKGKNTKYVIKTRSKTKY